MLAEEYVETKRVGKYAVHIGDDDNGQQMFAEWIDEEGQAQELSFGSYNTRWEDNLIYYFRTRHWCDKNDCNKCDYKGYMCKRNEEMVDQRMRLSSRGIPVVIGADFVHGYPNEDTFVTGLSTEGVKISKTETVSSPLIIKGSIDLTPLEDALKSFKTDTEYELHLHKEDEIKD